MRKQQIDASNYSLNEWLKLLLHDRESVLPNNHFPNETAREEYLKKVKKIPEEKVKNLLRNLLQRTGYSSLDIVLFNELKSLGKKKFDKVVASSEYHRKLLLKRGDIWEGLIWVLDLLPYHPKQAIQTLEAYLTANSRFILDYQIWCLSDCIDIITARYYDLEHPRDILLDIDPIEFEWLIEELYKGFGYDTRLSSKTNDKGIDILALKNNVGKKEKTIIQCKLYSRNIGSPFVRDLLGVVTSTKATKGVLVSVSEFTREAKKFADENSSIELIGYRDLNRLLNKHLGLKWPSVMRHIFRNKRTELSKQ